MTSEHRLQSFHVMAKPAGAACNLRCEYCYFLKKANLYPDGVMRMSDEIMEAYIKQTIAAHRVPDVTIAWQGGEPTLMGLEFFRRSMEIEKKYARPGMRIENTVQTNGVLIDKEWCCFLRENNFLVGLSLDGPREVHDAYRRDKSGNPVFDKVVGAVRLMQQENVQFNILCTVNAANSVYALDVYRFFRDEMQTPYLQFIPVVERDNETGFQEGARVTERSVEPEQYGRFLIEIFDEWVRNDVGKVFVQFFDGVLASWLRGISTICVLRPTCGESVALEHNGDVYSCDHFVEPDHHIGNILQSDISEIVNSPKQREFGAAKFETLPRECQECEYLFTCHGECPKNRISESGVNYLCPGLKAFFTHTEAPMHKMADLLRRGFYADEIMRIK